MRDFIFHDVDPILQRLVQLAEDLGYLVLAEVTGRNTSEKLARININETELRPFLRPAADEGGDPDHGVDLDPGDAEEPEDADAAEFDPAESLGRAVHVASASDLARAAFRWALQNAGSNMNSVRKCKFKLSAWSPKGDRLVYSARFSCEDPEFQVEEEEAGERPRQPPTLVPVSNAFPVRPPVPPVTVLAPVGSPVDKPLGVHPTLMLDAIPEGRVWKALGGGYEHLLHLYERGFGNLATLQNDALASLASQNVENQRVIGELADRVVTLRLGAAVAEREERDDTESARVRESLGSQVITQLGTIGRYVAAARFGLPEELSEIAEIIQGSPELLDAMKAPGVRAALREPSTQRELAQLLKIVGVGKASESPAPPSPPPADAPQAA